MNMFREMKYITGEGTCDNCGKHSFVRLKYLGVSICFDCFTKKIKDGQYAEICNC